MVRARARFLELCQTTENKENEENRALVQAKVLKWRERSDFEVHLEVSKRAVVQARARFLELGHKSEDKKNVENRALVQARGPKMKETHFL